MKISERFLTKNFFCLKSSYYILIVNRLMKKIIVDNKNNHHWLFYVIEKNIWKLPISIRIISLSSFLFVLWRWLWADTFFSLYIKTIVDNILWVSIIWWWLSAIRLLFTIPIWKLDDHLDMKSIIFLSKIFYVVSWFLYFFAGVFGSLTVLIFAVVFNGFASASLFTTFNSYIRHRVHKNKSWSEFALFFSSFNLAYVVWALISATFIEYLDLKYVFLFIVAFSFLSFFTDKSLPNLKEKKKIHVFSKESFLHQFFREGLSLKAFKETRLDIKSSWKSVFYGLKFEFLFGVLNYIGFIFIPIICFQNNLWLAQIAIVFAIMRLPYIIDLVLWSIADKYNKKWLIMVVLLFISLLYALLSYTNSFGGIVVISFGISLWLAIIRPIISAITSGDWNKNIIWSITWAEQFVWRLGDVVWAIWFGLLSTIVWLKVSFVVTGILLFLRSFVFLFKNFILKRVIKKN